MPSFDGLFLGFSKCCGSADRKHAEHYSPSQGLVLRLIIPLPGVRVGLANDNLKHTDLRPRFGHRHRQFFL